MISLYLFRLQLATLFVQMGQADDALMVLESDPNSERGDENIQASQADLFPLTDQDEVVEDSSTSKETPNQVGQVLRAIIIQLL